MNGWRITEVVGMAPVHVKPVVRWVFTEKQKEAFARRAAEQGLTMDDYLDQLFAEYDTDAGA